MLFFPWFFISIFIYFFKLNIFKEEFYFTIINRSTIIPFIKIIIVKVHAKETILLNFKVISDNYFYCLFILIFIQFLKVTFHLHVLQNYFLYSSWCTSHPWACLTCFVPSPPLWFFNWFSKKNLANSAVFKLDAFKLLYLKHHFHYTWGCYNVLLLLLQIWALQLP